MKKNVLLLTLFAIAITVVSVAIGAMAESRTPTHFAGLIEDYTPVAAGTGPWEIRGTWSLSVNKRDGTADFKAAVTMELSDSSLSDTSVADSARMQHTHHLTVEGGTIKQIAGGIEITGPVTITKDGGPVPAALQGSTLVIDIVGGNLVSYSNVTLRFEGGAINHFGSQPIHGVVRKADRAVAIHKSDL